MICLRNSLTLQLGWPVGEWLNRINQWEKIKMKEES